MSNDFLPFAVGGNANVLSQSAYAALTPLLQGGFTAGIANTQQLNKVWRQSSIMAAVLAQFIADQSGQNSVDDGTTATLEANLLAAVRNAIKQSVVLTDTGAANAYTAANTPALSALPTSSGLVQRVSIAHANTGASTYAPDGLIAKPIYGIGLQPLQGGELVVNGIETMMYVVALNVNSCNGAWVLLECTGAAFQTAPATASGHAVNLGQFGSSFSGSGYQKLPSGLIIQWGTVGTSNGSVTVTFPIAFPNAVFASSGWDIAAGVWTSTNVSVYGSYNATRTNMSIREANWTGSTFNVNGTGSVNWIAIGY
jgi:hypothetical protein